ncbi:DNA mismatch repair protein MutS [Desulfatibacillum aliphaticivorans]|uniref:DNA mismatch repair protein MutS n=1 Tax=Desulfatibacillum aliphaticivorans TaxID=218208 RepID=MUTS_DESAL|nr:DNA mismatch repair protein MutS [Desulfatibacillum aliphaticivorans]B8FJL5.1 RecName: Full=DNA mismatch repair protein MutS [Desulfatibacillum aliphaticivorans]ACL05684.1 DNA mismatch repair protein MutS [Desulfatibacillum aliphaticivorans]
MSAPKVTPMVRQYLSIKAEHPDSILFFRMGDFYEMFFEDAEKASKALDITLTSRNKNDPDPVPMCGVPHHSANGYVARLVEQGFKVAICDQVQDPSEAKGLVERKVVQVVTPGMQLDGRYLDASQNNFVCAAVTGRGGVGLAFLDISTGAFLVTQVTTPESAFQEILRMGPKELVLPEKFEENARAAAAMRMADQLPTSRLEGKDFENARTRDRLLEHFKTRSLEGFGIQDLPLAVRAAGALLHYVQQAQRQEITHVTKIQAYFQDQFLWIDDNSARNLELLKNIRNGTRQGALISVLDKTVTAMGARLMSYLLRYPLIDPQVINLRLDAVEQAKDLARVRDEVREALKEVHDLERLRSRTALGHANGRDLAAMGESLKQLPRLWALLKENFESPLLCGEATDDGLTDVADLIDRSIREDAPPGVRDGGMIKPGFNEELDEVAALATDVKGLIAGLEAQEKERTGISTLKVRYNKVFGYYIEISKNQTKSIPPHYVRKQTLVNAERYITDELKEFETKVLGAEERRVALEYNIFTQIVDRINGENDRLEKASHLIAWVDVLAALGHVADHNGYCRPVVDMGQTLDLQESRHPVVEKMLPGQRFVPNNIAMNNLDQQILMITGPNMAGKSTVLRQAALCVIMAQMGSFVPAEKAVVGVVDKIFTRVGALDNLSQGESTFMVEMQETANILNNVSHRSLVILDEIGRGTSTFDGLSIAWAVAEYLHDYKDHGVKTMFATHYHELTDLTKTHPRVKNFNIAVNEWNDEIIFLHSLVEGGTNKSYGIQVARLAGIPASVIRRSKQVLQTIEDSEEARVAYSAKASGKSGKKDVQVQMSLFPTPGELAAQALERMDINVMTPLEAMNVLSELQQRVKRPEKAPADVTAETEDQE